MAVQARPARMAAVIVRPGDILLDHGGGMRSIGSVVEVVTSEGGNVIVFRVKTPDGRGARTKPVNAVTDVWVHVPTRSV